MKKLILIAVMCLFSGLVISEEIVMNKDGKAVLLKDDNTWELVDTSKEQGKVVFSIAKAVDEFTANQEKKDDMEVVVGYNQNFGCQYYLTIENNTSHPVKIGDVGVGTNLQFDDMPASKIWGNTPVSWNWKGKIGDGRHVKDGDRNTLGEKYAMAMLGEVIKPGEKFVGSGFFDKVNLVFFVETTKEPISDEKIKEYVKKFGCGAQEGTVYLRRVAQRKFITFSEESGILSDDEQSKFVVGSSTGVAPLKEEIYWSDQFGKLNW